MNESGRAYHLRAIYYHRKRFILLDKASMILSEAMKKRVQVANFASFSQMATVRVKDMLPLREGTAATLHVIQGPNPEAENTFDAPESVRSPLIGPYTVTKLCSRGLSTRVTDCLSVQAQGCVPESLMSQASRYWTLQCPSPMQKIILIDYFHAINLNQIFGTLKRPAACQQVLAIYAMYLTRPQIADRDRDGRLCRARPFPHWLLRVCAPPGPLVRLLPRL